MKKIRKGIFAGIFSLICSGLIQTQSLILTSPNGGENWILGQTVSITWQASGITSGRYKLTLWDGETNLGTIVNGVNYTRNSHSWNVGTLATGATVNPGTRYRIKIRVISEIPKDFSDSFFTIGADEPERPESPGLIAITSPRHNDVLTMGSVNRIEWRKIREMDERVRIFLYMHHDTPGPTLVSPPITDDVENSGNFNWVVPGNLSPGRYSLRIITLDNAVNGYSEVFKLKEKQRFQLPDLTKKQLPVSIKPLKLRFLQIVYPKINDEWNLKYPTHDQPFPYRIVWRIIGKKKNDYVKIYLKRKSNSALLQLTDSTLNDGFFGGEITPQLKRQWVNGEYSVIITDLDGRHLGILKYINIHIEFDL